jgi:hypothetical protein
MTPNILESSATSTLFNPSEKLQMTLAMREGLEALQREFDAFAASCARTKAVIDSLRPRRS